MQLCAPDSQLFRRMREAKQLQDARLAFSRVCSLDPGNQGGGVIGVQVQQVKPVRDLAPEMKQNGTGQAGVEQVLEGQRPSMAYLCQKRLQFFGFQPYFKAQNFREFQAIQQIELMSVVNFRY